MSTIYGYRVTGTLGGVTFDEFVLDEGMLDRVHVSDESRYILEEAIKAASNLGSTTFHDAALSVEVITHTCDAPRYVLLRGSQGNRFFSRYNGDERWEIRKLDNGKIAYDILGFADSIAEVQRKLHRSPQPIFSNLHSLQNLSSQEVHRTHCCAKHGCKYGNNWCPVTTGVIAQAYECEVCRDDKQS